MRPVEEPEGGAEHEDGRHHDSDAGADQAEARQRDGGRAGEQRLRAEILQHVKPHRVAGDDQRLVRRRDEGEHLGGDEERNERGAREKRGRVQDTQRDVGEKKQRRQSHGKQDSVRALEFVRPGHASTGVALPIHVRGEEDRLGGAEQCAHRQRDADRALKDARSVDSIQPERGVLDEPDRVRREERQRQQPSGELPHRGRKP